VVEIRSSEGASQPATTSASKSPRSEDVHAWIYDIPVSSPVRIVLYCKPYRARAHAVLEPARASRAGNIDFSIKRASQLARKVRDRPRSQAFSNASRARFDPVMIKTLPVDDGPRRCLENPESR
jgi:hypothetical protein